MARIFLIEDNESIREAVTSYLKLENHEVIEFDRIQGVIDAISFKKPDLLILDVMLPDGNGFQLAKQIREDKGKEHIPILFLTARTTESDRITGFEVGGDDYVIKPFSPRELSLRVKAILRRNQRSAAVIDKSEWASGSHRLSMDGAAHKVTADDEEITLTTAEWNILDYLSSHAGMVINRERLLGECLEYTVEGSERTIDTHIKNLRAKLKSADWIETVRGFGYRFSGEPL
ncbi:Transcriptional regulatory protein SrrA [subsurface metagenome]